MWRKFSYFSAVTNKSSLKTFLTFLLTRNLKIVMLGISNTIDALEKYCEKLKINVNEVTNIVFNPYTVEQLKEIIIDRLD
jgi:Cdc6-like AAA superfamily ATPase